MKQLGWKSTEETQAETAMLEKAYQETINSWEGHLLVALIIITSFCFWTADWREK
jgi:hypothetical protein